MDIALLSEMVGELILDHDQVGLPGVGTFVAEVVPASFSDKGYTINPPYRRLSFYSSRLEEDLLIDFYASHNDLDRAAAKAYLTAFLAEMKTVLKDRKVVTFPGLGRLRATKENTFFFVPDEELDIYPDGFGLDSVSLKSHHESREEVSIAVSDLASILSSIPAAEPIEAPAAEPEPAPEQPVAEPVAPIEPIQTVEEPQHETSVAEPTAEPAAKPVEEPAAEPIPEPAPAPAEPNEKPTPAPAAPAAPAPKANAVTNAVSKAVSEDEDYDERSKRRSGRRMWRRPIGWLGWLLIILGLVALFFAAFFITAKVAPDFLDTLLYNEEELRIINY